MATAVDVYLYGEELVRLGGPFPSHPAEPTSPPADDLVISAVLASSDNGTNVAEWAIDDDLGTTFMQEGDGEWIRFDLGSVVTVGSIQVAWFKGDERIAFFDIEVSDDATNWTNVYSGQSSGLTRDFETFQIVDTDARYIRIVGHGNSTGTLWQSMYEVNILGSGGTAVPGKPVISVVGGNEQATISLESIDGPTPDTYTIRRSTTSGGPYTDIYTITSDEFPKTDTGIANDVTFYYVVAATNVHGTGPNSDEVSVVPGPTSVGGGSGEVLHIGFDNWSAGNVYTESRITSDWVTPLDGRLLKYRNHAELNGQLDPVIRNVNGSKMLVLRYETMNRFQVDFNLTLGPGIGNNYEELWWTQRTMWTGPGNPDGSNDFQWIKPSRGKAWVGKQPHLAGSDSDNVQHIASGGDEDVQSPGMMWVRKESTKDGPSIDRGTYYEFAPPPSGSGDRSNLVAYPYARYQGGYAFRPELSVKTDESNGELFSNRFYVIQHHLIMNTPGTDNGIWEIYIDGVLRWYSTGWLFRLNGQSFGWNKVRFAAFFGGTTDDSAHDWYEEIIYDYFNISEVNPL